MKLSRSFSALKAEFEKDFKLKNDPRVTPLGKFLRKTSIDELPQLWNVFRGEMALVGPRPIVEKEVAYYGASYEIFSLMKPGITGNARVAATPTTPSASPSTSTTCSTGARGWICGSSSALSSPFSA